MLFSAVALLFKSLRKFILLIYFYYKYSKNSNIVK